MLENGFQVSICDFFQHFDYGFFLRMQKIDAFEATIMCYIENFDSKFPKNNNSLKLTIWHSFFNEFDILMFNQLMICRYY